MALADQKAHFHQRGYDDVTGLGSPRGKRFLRALAR
jgi:hypothetical protein